MGVTTRSDQRGRCAASVRQVFDTAELLEMILLELGEIDLRTLLLSNRVDKSFNAIIESSTKLQKALFLRRDTTHITDDTLSSARINPLFDCDSPQCLPFDIQDGDIYVQTLQPTPVEWGMEFPIEFVGRRVEVVAIKCTDAILESCELLPWDMILLERRQGQNIPLKFFAYCFRYMPNDCTRDLFWLPDKDHVTVGDFVVRVMKGLMERYPQQYGED